MDKSSRQPSEMSKSIKRWLTAIGLSTALLLSSPIGAANKSYGARQQQTQQAQQHQQQQTQEAQPQTRQVVVGAPCNTWFVFTTYEEYKNQKEDINLLCDYLNLNIELFVRENKGLDTKEVCIKRKSLEERVEKILDKHLNGMLLEMYPMQNKRPEGEIKIEVDLIDTNSSIKVADRSGKLLYEKTFDKAFSRSTLKKLDDLAEFLGPDVIERWDYEFDEMSDEEFAKKIDELIAEAKKKKENNGKLERKYRSYAHYLGGYVLPFDNKIRITNRVWELSDIVLICGHEYGHMLHKFFPVSSKYEGEQKTLQETICDLLGGEASLRYHQRYLRNDMKRYKRYTEGIMQTKADTKMWKGLIEKVDKLFAEGKIDEAEKLMDKTAEKIGGKGYKINQANIAVAKLYYSNGDTKKEEGTRNKLEYMLKELSPDYLIETTKYITNFNELDYAYRLIKEINKKDKKELKKSYIENQEAIKKLEEEERKQDAYSNLYLEGMESDEYIDREKAVKEFMGEAHKYTRYRYIPHTWEQRKEFVRKSILLHELHERLPEKEVAEIIKEKVAEK